MKAFAQVFWGIFSVLLAGGILLGSFTMAMVESEPELALLPPLQVDYTASSTPLPLVDTLKPGEPTFTPTQTVLPLATKDLERHITSSSTPTLKCARPPGWLTIVIEWGDTLTSLASRFGITTEELAYANCLHTHSLEPGTLLSVPDLRDPAVLVTKPVESCGPPADWVFYIVRSGDTLYSLSMSLGVTIRQLQNANCMGNRILIVTGDRLAVPFIPVSTPMPSETSNPQDTPRSTATPLTILTASSNNLSNPTNAKSLNANATLTSQLPSEITGALTPVIETAEPALPLLNPGRGSTTI